LVTLPLAEYHYDSHWTLLSAGLPPAGIAASFAAPDPTVQRTSTLTEPDDNTTTTTLATTESPKTTEHDSMLGATANAVGTVIAAPFRWSATPLR
jgi:hypothetical protein